MGGCYSEEKKFPGPWLDDIRVPEEEYDVKTFGTRHQSGAPKGTGFLGVLRSPDRNIATEFTIGVKLDGEEVEIPTLVPSLSRGEVIRLLEIMDAQENGKKREIPRTIVNKAMEHARGRRRAHLSVFAD
jgi:hypothetical protein